MAGEKGNYWKSFRKFWSSFRTIWSFTAKWATARGAGAAFIMPSIYIVSRKNRKITIFANFFCTKLKKVLTVPSQGGACGEERYQRMLLDTMIPDTFDTAFISSFLGERACARYQVSKYHGITQTPLIPFSSLFTFFLLFVVFLFFLWYKYIITNTQKMAARKRWYHFFTVIPWYLIPFSNPCEKMLWVLFSYLCKNNWQKSGIFDFFGILYI